MAEDKATEYPETADIETSSEDYAGRFSSAAGKWMLRLQEKVVLGWIKHENKYSVLDVGGGHGQLAGPILSQGIDVTVLGSSDECAARLDSEKIKFVKGNIIEIPFGDKSFDTTVSIRLLPHCGEWQKLISELCRVAGKTVIVDYPTGQSVNCLSSMMFGMKKKVEGNTRQYRLFKRFDVRDEFKKNGFVLRSRKPEFFLPMVMHRMINCPYISSFLEFPFRILGLTGLFGSPILELYSREED
ncbi:hypothetical protein BVX94_02635 [bacterium B17]|nr:hypothetical protein BVX94_02635 [bacterium B17]